MENESAVVVAGVADEGKGSVEVGGSVDVARGEDFLEIINLSCHVWQWIIECLEHSRPSIRIIHSEQQPFLSRVILPRVRNR